MRRLLALLLLLAASPTGLALGQPTFVFKGKVVHLDQRLPPDASFRAEGLGPITLFDSGEFVLELPAATATLTLTTSHPRLEIIYPPAGRVAIPADRSLVTVIVVGEPVRQTITAALADRTRVLERRLQENGVQFNALQGTLEDGIQRILEKLDVREEDLRHAIEAQDQRARHFPRIDSTLSDYVVKAQDLRDVFALLGGLSDESPAALRALQSAVLAYNEAFQRLNNQETTFALWVRTYWTDEELLDDLKRWYTLALGDVHQDRILPLNESLRDLVTGRGAREAKQRIARIADELEPRLLRLQTDRVQLLEALARF